jgi:hypothetical protein
MIKIINHKKVDMTNDEIRMYEAICRSYDEPNVNRKGEDLFVDHFEVNSDGIITFVKPPQKRYSSIEVYCFLSSLMMNQHMRSLYAQNQSLINEATIKINSLIGEINALKQEVKDLIGDAKK